MTKREMLESIVDGTILNENKREEAAAIAAKELAQMDAALAKRKDKLTPQQEENLVIANAVYEKLSTESCMTATMVYEIGIEGITSIPKASSILRLLVKTGRASVEDVVVKGKTTTIQKGYRKI